MTRINRSRTEVAFKQPHSSRRARCTWPANSNYRPFDLLADDVMNGRTASYVILLVLLLHVIGLIIFCKGFLLARVVISLYSGCDHHKSVTSNEGDVLFSCNAYPRRFKRVVWVLVDALRYDFTVFDKETGSPAAHYKNQMPLLNQLLQDHPRHARRFKFVADPPTTTMQRLKALTTGSLPTFVDISSNFNSYEILEDNLIYQCRQNGMKTAFLGDDTWLGLYPGLLDKSYAYPSLNVQDLDTVDDGVISHIGTEIRSKEADFLIGHFLGVDHCGHTYGPAHVEMSRKLTQMDGVIV